MVWILEHFKSYLYGSQLTLQTGLQVLLSALKETRGNKTYQSRLTRWIDQLLPFHFKIEYLGKNVGFADYLSRNPHGTSILPSDRDKNIVINTINDIKHSLLQYNLAPHGAISIEVNKSNDTKYDPFQQNFSAPYQRKRTYQAIRARASPC